RAFVKGRPRIGTGGSRVKARARAGVYWSPLLVCWFCWFGVWASGVGPPPGMHMDRQEPPSVSRASVSGPRSSAIPSSVPGPPLARMKRLLRKNTQAIASTPLEFQLLGKTLLHAALVGAAAGLVGSLFVALVELVQRVLLEDLAGYEPLKAAGELLFDGSP